MMGPTLLDKIRRISMCAKTDKSKHCMEGLCNHAAKVLRAGILVVDDNGKIRVSETEESVSKIPECDAGNAIDEVLNERLGNILSIKENVDAAMLGLSEDAVGDYIFSILPMCLSGERTGTVLVYSTHPLIEEDIVFAEYFSSVAELRLFCDIRAEKQQKAAYMTAAKTGVRTLSVYERESAKRLFRGISGNDGIVVSGKVADEMGISRSTIVSALRKLEESQLIESRSSGMKGTHIQILNPYLRKELGLPEPEAPEQKIVQLSEL